MCGHSQTHAAWNIGLDKDFPLPTDSSRVIAEAFYILSSRQPNYDSFFTLQFDCASRRFAAAIMAGRENNCRVSGLTGEVDSRRLPAEIERH